MNRTITHTKAKGVTGLACLLLFFSLLSACRYDDLSVAKPNENFRMADDFIKNNYDFSLFSEALQYTGLADTLHLPGPYTVVAPNNSAFNELGIQLPGDIRRLNRDSLRQAMAYHIINRKLLLANMPVNGIDVRYETLAGIQLYMSLISFSPVYPDFIRNNLYFSGSEAYRKDVTIVNGTLHAIEKVMKQYPGKTVQQWLAARADYSVFVAGLQKFGLWQELSGPGPFTIFAPDNKAFASAGITLATVESWNVADYIGARLLGAYIFYNKNYFTTDVSVAGNANNESSYITTPRNDNAYIEWFGALLRARQSQSLGWSNDATVNKHKSDHLCENGIVHTLDNILIKPENARAD